MCCVTTFYDNTYICSCKGTLFIGGAFFELFFISSIWSIFGNVYPIMTLIVCKHVDRENVGLGIIPFWEVFEALGLHGWGSIVTHLFLWHRFSCCGTCFQLLWKQIRRSKLSKCPNQRRITFETSLLLHYNKCTIAPQFVM